jgi:Coenzyme PQQ synthesis protein D (PqqD)
MENTHVSAVYRRAVELLEADIHDELVALEPQGGTCFGFNAVAASVWRLLDTPKSFAELRDSLLSQYDVAEDECSADLQELLDGMKSAGLIAIA